MEKESDASWRNPYFEQGEGHPVVCVSWNDAKAFCEWAGLGIPTEAQWEYACRAGTWAELFVEVPGTNRLTVSYDLGAYAWYDENSGRRTHPVGKKLSNAWGLHDIQGNTWEWCADWYDEDYYEKSPRIEPARETVTPAGLPPADCCCARKVAAVWRDVSGAEYHLFARRRARAGNDRIEKKLEIWIGCLKRRRCYEMDRGCFGQPGPRA